MVRLALRGSGADRLPASAVDTSQDLFIKGPIMGLSTVILRCCAAMITMIVRRYRPVICARSRLDLMPLHLPLVLSSSCDGRHVQLLLQERTFA